MHRFLKKMWNTSSDCYLQDPQLNLLLKGLVTDTMEDRKAWDLIAHVLNILKGLRPTDVILERYCSGSNIMDSSVVLKMVNLNRMIDYKMAEIIETLINYRAHSSQSDAILECFITGKNYQGPLFNSVVREAKVQSMDYVFKLLMNLYDINCLAIDMLKE